MELVIVNRDAIQQGAIDSRSGNLDVHPSYCARNHENPLQRGFVIGPDIRYQICLDAFDIRIDLRIVWIKRPVIFDWIANRQTVGDLCFWTYPFARDDLGLPFLFDRNFLLNDFAILVFDLYGFIARRRLKLYCFRVLQSGREHLVQSSSWGNEEVRVVVLASPLVEFDLISCTAQKSSEIIIGGQFEIWVSLQFRNLLLEDVPGEIAGGTN